jgi:uncharacterized membrane protein YdbT with pleckstrin-like domain
LYAASQPFKSWLRKEKKLTMSTEEVIVCKRETIWRLSFWLKLIFTLGIHIFWWRANSLTVTNRQIVWKKGLIGTQERSVPLHQVQDVSVNYKPIGQLLGYGTIRIETAGGPETEIVAEKIAGPGEIRDAILDQLASEEQK